MGGCGRVESAVSEGDQGRGKGSPCSAGISRLFWRVGETGGRAALRSRAPSAPPLRGGPASSASASGGTPFFPHAPGASPAHSPTAHASTIESLHSRVPHPPSTGHRTRLNKPRAAREQGVISQGDSPKHACTACAHGRARASARSATSSCRSIQPPPAARSPAPSGGRSGRCRSLVFRAAPRRCRPAATAMRPSRPCHLCPQPQQHQQQPP